MLVLSRRKGEAVHIGHEIEMTVLEIRGGRVKLGFIGPQEVPIHRKELHQKINQDPSPRYHAECA
jgi:carbon storage regulator